MIPGLGRPSLEKEMATNCSILAWEIPWTEEPGGATVHRVTRSWTRLKHSVIFKVDYLGQGLPQQPSSKEYTRQEPQETWFYPWVGKIPWRRARQPTSVFLPGESHAQRSLEGYSP